MYIYFSRKCFVSEIFLSLILFFYINTFSYIGDLTFKSLLNIRELLHKTLKQYFLKVRLLVLDQNTLQLSTTLFSQPSGSSRLEWVMRKNQLDIEHKWQSHRSELSHHRNVWLKCQQYLQTLMLGYIIFKLIEHFSRLKSLT